MSPAGSEDHGRADADDDPEGPSARTELDPKRETHASAPGAVRRATVIRNHPPPCRVRGSDHGTRWPPVRLRHGGHLRSAAVQARPGNALILELSLSGPCRAGR